MQYLSIVDHHAPFEELYLKVRARENRLLADEVVARLPDISPEMSPNYKEWKARSGSFKRLKKYFQSTKESKALLDVGCGNGWAAAGLAGNELLEVAAVDVNEEELLQAERIFQKPNLLFYYGNIFEDIFPPSSFDFIVLNSSAQYFEDLKTLVERLFYFLKKGGEIHILDTPFYSDSEWEVAKSRTQSYFRSIGCPEMAKHYFHHRLAELAPFKYETVSKKGILDKLRSPFSDQVPANFIWIKIQHS